MEVELCPAINASCSLSSGLGKPEIPPFFRRELCEIYHLKTDPLELHNLAGHLPESRIAKELSLLERRFDALRRNFETQPNPFHDVDPFGKRMAKTDVSALTQPPRQC